MRAFLLSTLLLALVGLVTFACALPHQVVRGAWWMLLAGLAGWVWRRGGRPRLTPRALLASPVLGYVIVAFALCLMFLCRFSAAELAAKIPWDLAMFRTDSYYVPDNILQQMLSHNLVTGSPLETGFNPDGNGLWSVGDRPMLLGLIDAALTVVTGNHDQNLFFTRTIAIAAFFVVPCAACLVRKPRWVSALLLLVVFAHPYFLNNLLYTWPKMFGLAYAAVAFALVEEGDALVFAGTAAGFAVVSHGAYVFLPLFLGVYGAFRGYSWRKAWAFLTPLAVLDAAQIWFTGHYTNNKNLLMRMNLCHDGSYADVTPRVPLLDACRAYLERSGVSGVFQDHVLSLNRGLFDGFGAFWQQVVSGDAVAINRAMNLTPLYAYGAWSVPVFVLVAAIPGIRKKLARELMLVASAFVTLLVFLALCAAPEQVAAHTLPYFAVLVLFLSTFLFAASINNILFIILAGAWLLFGPYVWLAVQAQHIARFPGGVALTTLAVAMIAAGVALLPGHLTVVKPHE